MKCLVTGGAGFIGSNLVDRLIEADHSVVVIDNESSDAHDKFYWNVNAINYVEDISNHSVCDKIFKKHKPDYVFHLAAEARIQACIDNPIKAIEINSLATGRLLELSKLYNVKKFLYSSTSAVYGLSGSLPSSEQNEVDCLNPYSLSKFMGEKLCKMYYDLYNVKSVIFRYFNVYGERQPIKGQYAPVIGIFQRQFKNKQSLSITGTGQQKRDFIHVSDVVSANINGMLSPTDSAEIYNVGSGKNYTINEIANAISGDIVYLPPRLGECIESLADIQKIKSQLQWEPKMDLLQWMKKAMYV